MKPSKPTSKQICQDLCWKAHYRAKPFALLSYTKHQLRNQPVSRSKQLFCFVQSKLKRTKTNNKKALSSSITILLY